MPPQRPDLHILVKLTHAAPASDKIGGNKGPFSDKIGGSTFRRPYGDCGYVWSDAVDDVPDEGAEAEFGALVVEGAQLGQDRSDALVGHDGDDG